MTVKVFDDETVADAAFRHYRETGFPYRDLPLWECMRQINRLAATPDGKLIRSVTAY